MKLVNDLAALAIAATILTGCAGVAKLSDNMSYKTGSYVTDEQVASLQAGKGKTTQEQVIKVLGFPADKLNVSGKEVWRYPYTKINGIPFAGENESFTTVVEFNAKGIMLDAYKANGSAGNSSNPLLKAAGN
jgi:outer membrane protein assembly factor BamE (lipoprotein component of BamABCDE complex)